MERRAHRLAGQELHLFGPGVDSGTYDYFTEAVTGKEHSSRGDFTSSEDDNVLVQGIATDPLALGFFGYAYYVENKARLRVLPVDDGSPANGDGPIEPSLDTVRKGTYQPLSRPLFVYFSKRALDKPEVGPGAGGGFGGAKTRRVPSRSRRDSPEDLVAGRWRWPRTSWTDLRLRRSKTSSRAGALTFPNQPVVSQGYVPNGGGCAGVTG